MIESILVVEDQALLRETFVNVLRNEGISEALYEAQEGEEAVRVAEVLQPSLILLDIELPDSSGFDFYPRIGAVAPESVIVFLSMHSYAVFAIKAFALGARGYLTKSMPFDQVIVALQKAMAGEQVLDPAISPEEVDEGLQRQRAAVFDEWPPRQLQVLSCLLSGLGASTIATDLGLSEKTVESYRSKIFRQLGVSSSPELIVKGQEEGFALLVPMLRAAVS